MWERKYRGVAQQWERSLLRCVICIAEAKQSEAPATLGRRGILLHICAMHSLNASQDVRRRTIGGKPSRMRNSTRFLLRSNESCIRFCNGVFIKAAMCQTKRAYHERIINELCWKRIRAKRYAARENGKRLYVTSSLTVTLPVQSKGYYRSAA